jgi:ATP-dependent Lhr-like helicase
MTPHDSIAGAQGLSEVARQVLEYLRQRGASFFADIVRATGKLKAEIETGLWELVAGGVVTADGFDNLRALIDPKRRAGQGSGRTTRPRHSAGRWAILHTDSAVERDRVVEATCWMMLKRYESFSDLLLPRPIFPSGVSCSCISPARPGNSWRRLGASSANSLRCRSRSNRFALLARCRPAVKL